MSDFLKQLEEVTANRNDTNAIKQKVAEFGERYFNALSDAIVAQAKKVILEAVQKKRVFVSKR